MLISLYRNKDTVPTVLLLILLSGCATERVLDNDMTESLAEAAKAYQSRDYETAIELYEDLALLLPQDSEVWFRLGNAYARSDRSREALEAYTEVLVRNPQDSRAWHNRGLLQLELAAGNYSEAAVTLQGDDAVREMASSVSEEILQLLRRINRESQLTPLSAVSNNSAEGVEIIVLNRPQMNALLGDKDLTSSYSNQDLSGFHSLTRGVLTLTGNTWRKVLIDYEVTPDTLLSFEVRIQGEGEIHGVGLDEDDDFENHVRLFQIAGSQLWSSKTEGDGGDGAWQAYQYSANGHWQRFVIPVGQYYTGNFKYLVFANDDDAQSIAISEYREVGLSEGRALSAENQ